MPFPWHRLSFLCRSQNHTPAKHQLSFCLIFGFGSIFNLLARNRLQLRLGNVVKIVAVDFLRTQQLAENLPPRTRQRSTDRGACCHDSGSDAGVGSARTRPRRSRTHRALNSRIKSDDQLKHQVVHLGNRTKTRQTPDFTVKFGIRHGQVEFSRSTGSLAEHIVTRSDARAPLGPSSRQWVRRRRAGLCQECRTHLPLAGRTAASARPAAR